MSGEATLSRRTALKLLAGQMTLLVAGCSPPREEIVPYVRMPARLIPGVPLQFATTLELGGYGRGVLCTSVEGRPIKIEGNPLHPASLGATDALAEAAVLSLYDPDRSQASRSAGQISNWPAFLDAVKPRLEALVATNGEGLRLLTGPVCSPTLSRQIGLLHRRFPALQWHVHDPLFDSATHDGALAAFGRPVLPIPRLGDAEILVSLDADPLGPGPMQIVNARGFAARRRVRKDGAEIGRLYAIEASPTLTGANADHRLVVPPAEIAAMAITIARGLGADLPKPDLPREAAAFGDEIARDVAAHRGRALVIPGAALPADIHALCHWINAQLPAPIDHFEARPQLTSARSLADLVGDLDAGKVEDLFVLSCNPAYDSPPALGFVEAVAKAEIQCPFRWLFRRDRRAVPMAFSRDARPGRLVRPGGPGRDGEPRATVDRAALRYALPSRTDRHSRRRRRLWLRAGARNLVRAHGARRIRNLVAACPERRGHRRHCGRETFRSFAGPPEVEAACRRYASGARASPGSLRL